MLTRSVNNSTPFLLCALVAFLSLSTTLALAQETPEEAERLNNLVVRLYQEGRYEEAIPLAERAVKIRTHLLSEGKSATEGQNGLAASLVNLASLYRSTSRFEKVEGLLLQALQIKKQASGIDIDYSRILNNLALLYDDTGRYEKAEPIYQEAAEIRKRVLGPDHQDYATIINNLASLYKNTGRYDKAEQLYLQALEIGKKLDPQGVMYATSLNNLALLYAAAGGYKKAEPLSLEASTIIRRSLGANHPSFAQSLNNLALLYKNTGRYDKAETMYLEAIGIQAKSGAKDTRYATSLNNLADLYKTMGRYQHGRELFSQAANLYESLLGIEHPAYAGILENIALLDQATGRSREAFALMTRAMDIEQVNLRRMFDVSSENAMRAYLLTVNGSLHGLISMANEQRNEGTAEVALKWVLRRKGIILDTLVDYRRSQLLAQNNPAFAESVARLRYLRQQMSNLPLNRPAGISDTDLRGRLAALREESEQLESKLNRSLSTQRQGPPSDEIDSNAVKKKLPPGTALIEFMRTEMYDFKATGHQPRWRRPRYFAFVLTGSASTPIRLIDLGEAAQIDEAIVKARQSIIQFQEDWKSGRIDSRTGPVRLQAIKSEVEAEREYRQTARRLYDLVFAPLRPLLGSRTKLVYVAADDQLNLVPFSAMVDADNRYLLNSYQFSYLASGRDLLLTRGISAGGTVVFGDPDYNMTSGARAQKVRQLLARSQNNAMRETNSTAVRRSQFRSNSTETKRSAQARGGLRWDRLPASSEEAKAVEHLLKGTEYGGTRRYVSSEALEEVLKQIRSPRILHISTHGFFPDQTTGEGMDQGPLDLGSGNAAILGLGLLRRSGNVLLQSGLVLAGANTIGNNQTKEVEVDDGWVTAEEIALLNLQGTELVVLSACGSGLGAVSAGEGVYGLRRAFQNAGAGAIVSTLFEVPDKESGQMMRSFYQGLRARRGKIQSLHDAQQQMIKARSRVEGAAHPFFWASFVLLGDPS